MCLGSSKVKSWHRFKENLLPLIKSREVICSCQPEPNSSAYEYSARLHTR